MNNNQQVFKNLKPGRAALFLALSVTIISCFFCPDARADKIETSQTIEYNVFAGGIHALRATLNIDENTDSYQTALSAKTYGLLGKLAPWHGTFETKGWKIGGEYQPEAHISATTWRDEKEIKEYLYKRNGAFDRFLMTDIYSDREKRHVDAELTDQTSDVLSATLATLQTAAQENTCEGTTDIFDGKRRFTLIFHHKQDVVLEKSKYNAYEGNAIECTVEVQPKGGEWHKKPRGWLSIQEQGRQKGTMPTVWLANVNNSMNNVPVKVRVKTNYGTLFMHMTEYSSVQKDGKPIKLALEK